MTTLKTEHEAQRVILEDLIKEKQTLKLHNISMVEYIEQLEKDLENCRHFAKFYRKQINEIYKRGLDNG